MLWLRDTLTIFFFFNDTATTEIYTLSLHDALPISQHGRCAPIGFHEPDMHRSAGQRLQPQCPRSGVEIDYPGTVKVVAGLQDRKSTRLKSSHANISYAVFCLKKKKMIAGHNYSSYK